MIAVLLLSLLAAAGGGEVRARLRVEPAEVELGMPFDLVLEVTHPPQLSVALPAGVDPEGALDDTWVLLGSRREAPVRDPEDGTRRLTRRTWQLVSLETGTRTLPAALLSSILPESTEVLETATVSIEVGGVLGEGEDEPRPLAGLPAGFGEWEAGVRRAWLPWALGGAAGVLVASFLWSWRRSRRKEARAVPGPSALERLERIAAELASSSAEIAERHYELSSLIRETADRARGSRAEGLTDVEWLRELARDAHIAREAHEQVEDAMLRLAEVKYAGQRPTGWALEETLEKVRRALEAVSRNGEAA